MTDALAINLEAPCWLFQGYVDRNGYGKLHVRGRGTVWAHRRMWELMRGAIPASLTIDHLCRIPACVNPQHMELVTIRENLRRGNGWAGRHAKATHCPQGHPYDERNTKVRDGKRYCRECLRVSDRRRHDAAYWREYRHRRREEGRTVGCK